MNELDLVRRIARLAPRAGSGVVLGIGDDCAVVRVPGSQEDLLFTTDMMIEDVHFRRGTHPPEAVGWKTLARGLSDIAAMGGEPRFCLLSLALAPWADDRWVTAFYRGLGTLARRTNVTLAGGDLARASHVTCDIVVCGAVPRGKALRRDGARAGDAIYVSGRLGASAFGLETGKGPAWKKHLRPEPRIALGQFVREKLHATACMDLSDGLSLDLHRLALASGGAAELTGDLPGFPGATEEQALHGGEDYELLFTVRPRTPVPIKIGNVPMMTVGTFRKGKPGRVLLRGHLLEPLGYDHFSGDRNL